MAKLTHTALKGLKLNQWRSDASSRGAGTLAARRTKTGVQFYFRYVAESPRQRVNLPLGDWAREGGSLTLQEARARARELSTRYQAGERDLRGALEAEEREAKRQREADRLAREAEEARQEATLGALLDAYVAQLEHYGKTSAKSVRAALRRHVKQAWPKLTKTPADSVTAEDLVDVLSRLTRKGLRNEARKLRSYLQSAYTTGIQARLDANSLPALRKLRITTNPARELRTIDGASGTKDRALSIAELRAYWKRINAISDPDGSLLRFHLLTGGQRIQQLSRLKVEDYDRDTETIRLWDTKGRRKKPRAHDLPLIQAASDAMTAMQGGRMGPYLFTITAGESGASDEVMRRRVHTVVDAMEDARELEHGRFTPSDLRRTIETRLAASGVSQEARAQLQSHGLGGVQTRHYDRHDYLQEKRAALNTLYQILTSESAIVTPIQRQKHQSA